MAKELVKKKDYAKAEDYFKRAKSLYVKQNNREKIAAVDREIAKVQEAQGKISEAITSYSSASKISAKKDIQAINSNDANRLSAPANLEVQAMNIQSNIGLMNSSAQRKERSQAHQQMAQINVQQGNKEEAISNLEDALMDEPEAAFEIQREIANVYVADNQLDKAIEINENLVEEAKKTKDVKVEIEQLQALSSNYLEAEDRSKSIDLLEQAYDLAMNTGRTIEAKNVLKQLTEQYREEKNTQKALDAYAGFMDNLETMIQADSTLIDTKAFQIQEGRITQLEKEKVLKDELIKKQNIFNYVLSGFILFVLVFLFFIAKALYSIKKKNKRIALQSLRREMNPHFIFNSLNSVNQFIAQNNELEANKYLSSYSKLMRNVMENSNKDFIPLSAEIEQLKEYLELEYMRFHDKFRYEINIDKDLDTDAVSIPNMLIQPQLENAVWHGLRYSEANGLLTLTVKNDGNKLSVIIEDNGIGIKRSNELKTKHQREHKSRGLTNTQERISLLNSLYNIDIFMEIKDKTADETGVIVMFSFPFLNKKLL
ncbi:sensor histidine kinase [Dysgonomonas sp. 520]|nr:sensor histidine kinase [Dysgonomonas sp. 520]